MRRATPHPSRVRSTPSPQGEGFRLGANILRQTLIYRYVYTFGTTHRSFPTDKMLRHRHLPLRGRVVPYGISILFVRLIIVLGDDSTKGFPLRGSWRGTRLMRCSRPQTALSFHTHKVTVSWGRMGWWYPAASDSYCADNAPKQGAITHTQTPEALTHKYPL